MIRNAAKHLVEASLTRSTRVHAAARWWVVSLLFGFYFANTLSLTFGALGVNDVVAGIVCLVGHEIITKEHYSREPRYAENSIRRRPGRPRPAPAPHQEGAGWQHFKFKGIALAFPLIIIMGACERFVCYMVHEERNK